MLFSLRPRSSIHAGLLGSALLLVACGGGTPFEPYAGPPIANLVRQIAGPAGVTAVADTTPAPLPGTAPTLTVVGIPAIINGGSSPVTVSSTGTITRVFLEATGYSGHWTVTLPAGVTTQDLVLTMADTLPGSTTRFVWSAEIGGQISPVTLQSARTVRVGSGDVQVSVAWTGASDVDLWAVSPANDTIYYGNKVGSSTGRLDLDSNPACSIDNTNNENIVWATGSAPRGVYKVIVKYFAACAATRSDYVVTAQVRGQAPRVYSGSFVGASGSANPPVEAITFTY